MIGRRPPIVLVPKYIGCPFPQANAAAQGENRGLNRDTSPGLFNIRPPRAQLVTMYVHWLTVQVQDQFRVNLDELYEGAPVRETFLGERRARNRVINQFLDAQGRYQA